MRPVAMQRSQAVRRAPPPHLLREAHVEKLVRLINYQVAQLGLGMVGDGWGWAWGRVRMGAGVWWLMGVGVRNLGGIESGLAARFSFRRGVGRPCQA